MKDKCKVENCCRDSQALGYCNMHYQRFIKHGNTDCNKPLCYWTNEEDEFMKRYFPKKGSKYVAGKLGKSENAVYKRAFRLGIKSKRYFTEDETTFIENHADWSNARIAKSLRTTPEAIRAKRYNEQIGTILDSQEEMLCIAEIGRMVGKHKSTIGKCWITKGLPYKQVGQYKMVTIKNLLKFMKNNPKKYDATECEEWFFRSYKWYQDKLKEDSLKKRKKRWGEFYEVS